MKVLRRIWTEVWTQKAVLLTVVVGLLATNYALRLYLLNSRQENLTVYSHDAERQRQSISDRLSMYETLMNSGRSLWLSSDNVSQAVWNRFFRFEALDQGAVDAFGIVTALNPADGRQFAQLQVVEPFNRTLTLHGSNLFRNTKLKRALVLAGNTSGPVIVDASDSLLRASHGYLTVVEAIYKPAEPTPQFVGWVLLSINLERCLGDIGSHRLALEVGDTHLLGTQKIPRNWTSEEDAVPIFGRQLTLITQHPIPQFPMSAWFIVAAGLSFTLAISSCVWSLTSTGSRAKRLAEKMTESLRVQERENTMLAMIARQTQNAVVVLDANEAIEWSNDAFKLVVGESAEHAEGTHFSVFLASLGGEPEKITEISRALGAAQPFGFEVKIEPGKGRSLVVAVKGTPFVDPATGVVRTVIIGEDATARVFYEEGLRTAHHLAEEASRAKSAFLANMSHEIRTPLNGIIGVIHLLESSTSAEDRRDLIGIISRSAESLLGILNDVLDFSRIEAGQLQLESDPFDLEEALEEVSEAFERIATLKGVSFVFSPDPAIDRFLVGDRLRLLQVVRNLLSNAIKFTKEGFVSLEATASEEGLTITVADSGIGIPEDRLESVFESFTQVDAGVTRRYGGTGLGLAICQQLVDRFGGRIEVSSTAGEGSRFSIVIPATWGEHHPEPWRQPRPSAGLAAQVCTKSPLQAEAALKWLHAWGYEVALTEGPDVALSVRSSDETGWIEFEALFRPRALFEALNRGPDQSASLDDLIDVLPRSGKVEVLLVDDNAVNRKVGSRLLEQYGCVVNICEDGSEAVLAASGRRFDLILMDIQMPVMDGIEAIQRIRASNGPNRTTRIVALTARVEHKERQEAMDAGADQILSKPLRLQEFVQVIKEAEQQVRVA